MSSRYRTIVEDHLFASQSENLGYTDDQLSRALDSAVWALSTNPEYYPVIPGTQRLRVIKTDPYSDNQKWIPALKIWFVIQDKNTIVLKGITLSGDDE